VLNAVLSSLSTRLNPECISIIKNISSVMTNDDSFEPAVRQLFSIAKLDVDQCLADSKLLFANAIYKSIAAKSSLQRFTATMVELQHNKLCKHYYVLMIFFTNTACNFFIMQASTQ